MSGQQVSSTLGHYALRIIRASSDLKMKRVVLVTLLLAGTVSAQDQGRISDPNFHTWYMYFGDHHFGDEPWGLHFDVQIRRQGVGEKWQQLLLRPGINYDLTDTLQVSFGYVFVRSYPYGDFPAPFAKPEHSIWEQLILKQPVGSVGLTQRFRFEQRWVGIKIDDGSGQGRLDRFSYRNRFRYFLKAAIPLRRDSSGHMKYYLGLYDEIMMGFGSEVQKNIFDQNRAYAALGFRLDRSNKLELGYMQQTVQQGSGQVIEYNHTLQIAWFSSAPLGR